MNTRNLRILLAVLSSLPFSSIFATENGNVSYPLGGDTFYAGALPPPGTYLLGYYENYHASKFVDKNGNSSIPDFGVNVNMFAPRVVWVTDKKVLGGSLAFHLVQPMVDIRASAAGQSDSRFGMGDSLIATALSWKQGSHNYTTGLEVAIPIGEYSKHNMANPGSNYATYRAMAAYSYIDPKWDASAKITYNYSTENDDTKYKSGQYFAGDYNLSYRIFPNVALGVQGYVLKQVTDDKVNGNDIDFNGQVIGIGPGLIYQSKKGWSIEAKYITETAVENRPKGDATWVRLVMPLH
ncbi:transporter [Acinetobacter lactucae]|uniref:SphA family protein n=1 Tax=Acinetobacter lactucae TaxID=1785128 RepID=UPI0021CD7F21|nr:transporter [Acinetobacter lactucae]MCU4347723.1 transporter [Acinetobacter lactucae]